MKLIVVSEDFNSRLSGELSQLLSKHGGVLRLGNNIIEASYIDTPEYVITDIGAKLDNSLKNTISVEISKNGDIINEALIYNDSAGIKQRLNIGTDFKDDITLSSLNDEEIHFGIQTIIKDLSGKNIYPCEIKSKTSDITDIHTLLTAAGILLISGKYHENNGIFKYIEAKRLYRFFNGTALSLIYLNYRFPQLLLFFFFAAHRLYLVFSSRLYHI